MSSVAISDLRYIHLIVFRTLSVLSSVPRNWLLVLVYTNYNTLHRLSAADRVTQNVLGAETRDATDLGSSSQAQRTPLSILFSIS